MQKLNSNGTKLLSFKKELLKDEYPQIVIDSLVESVDKFLELGLIDEQMKDHILNDNMNPEQLEVKLLKDERFVKTRDELISDFEALRVTLDSELRKIYGVKEDVMKEKDEENSENKEEDNSNDEDEDIDILENDELSDINKTKDKEEVIRKSDEISEVLILENLKTKSIIDRDLFIVYKSFSIDETFMKDYFGIKDDKSFLKLIRSKGFLEKFAILRLPKVIKSFKDSIKDDISLNLEESLVYSNKARTLFSIDLIIEVPLEFVEDEDTLSGVCKEVKSIDSQSDTFFEEKMQI